MPPNWRLIEVTDGTEADLTDAELIGIAIMLRCHGGEPADDFNVYYRAWRKLQPSVRRAIDRDLEDSGDADHVAVDSDDFDDRGNAR